MAPAKSLDGLAAQVKELELQVKELKYRLEIGDICVDGIIRRTCSSAGEGEPFIPCERVIISALPCDPAKAKKPKRR